MVIPIAEHIESGHGEQPHPEVAPAESCTGPINEHRRDEPQEQRGDVADLERPGQVLVAGPDQEEHDRE